MAFSRYRAMKAQYTPSQMKYLHKEAHHVRPTGPQPSKMTRALHYQYNARPPRRKEHTKKRERSHGCGAKGRRRSGHPGTGPDRIHHTPLWPNTSQHASLCPLLCPIHPLHMTHSQECTLVLALSQHTMALQPPPQPPKAGLLSSAARNPPNDSHLTPTGIRESQRSQYWHTVPLQADLEKPLFVGHIRVCVLRARYRAQALCPAHYLGSPHRSPHCGAL